MKMSARSIKMKIITDSYNNNKVIKSRGDVTFKTVLIDRVDIDKKTNQSPCINSTELSGALREKADKRKIISSMIVSNEQFPVTYEARQALIGQLECYPKEVLEAVARKKCRIFIRSTPGIMKKDMPQSLIGGGFLDDFDVGDIEKFKEAAQNIIRDVEAEYAPRIKELEVKIADLEPLVKKLYYLILKSGSKIEKQLSITEHNSEISKLNELKGELKKVKDQMISKADAQIQQISQGRVGIRSKEYLKDEKEVLYKHDTRMPKSQEDFQNISNSLNNGINSEYLAVIPLFAYLYDLDFNSFHRVKLDDYANCRSPYYEWRGDPKTKAGQYVPYNRSVFIKECWLHDRNIHGNFCVRGFSSGAVAIHEFAHAYDFILKECAPNFYEKFHETSEKKFKEFLMQREKFPSGYAKTNLVEFVAESITYYYVFGEQRMRALDAQWCAAIENMLNQAKELTKIDKRG